MGKDAVYREKETMVKGIEREEEVKKKRYRREENTKTSKSLIR